MAETVQIAVRTRPFNAAELAQNDKCCLSMVSAIEEHR
jgi:hypothetical protein